MGMLLVLALVTVLHNVPVIQTVERLEVVDMPLVLEQETRLRIVRQMLIVGHL
jgi:hypothetical protein